ncbi:MAG: chromosome segregation protein SMC, partial [Nitriliruptorales bacterium]|nr:chromosome segregation protein SMC [Nitriliruptorales bacterium]
MFLTSLTLRGFKSFANRTVLDVEPGITVIVGPNGSGKSNVVDALAWVLGTHSAKKVRGGAMADVIFAGSPDRPPLGQAKVEITIDNSQGQLGSGAVGTAESAQQFSEVRVGRTVYPSGESVYEINGEEVRALDVQELLSDTGLGRELHTIVGQGQLDEILNAKPEERRGFVEEAAGILKHRRRRERAIRKLGHVDDHIDKLASILRELRRQLRPLERQAEAANKHAQLQAELREVQIQLAAHDLALLTARRDRDQASDQETAARERAAASTLAQAKELLGEHERKLERQAPRAEGAQATYYRLSSLLERLRGTADLIEARRRHLIEYVEEPLAGRPPEELRAQAERLDEQRAEREREREQQRAALEAAVGERRGAEQRRRAHEQELQEKARQRAEQRERMLRWEGEVSALRGAIASAEAELGRVTAQLESLDSRVEDAQDSVDEVQQEIQGLDAREVELTAELEATEAEVARATAKVEELEDALTALERERSSQAARAEALRAALAERDGGVSALLEADLDGILGAVADHVRPDADVGPALAAALGPLGEAVVVTSPDQARRAVAWLRDVDAGAAVVLAARPARIPPPDLDEDAREQLDTAGAVPIADHLAPASDDETSRRVVAAIAAALTGTYLVDAWDKAVLLHGRNPGLTFVTPDGDVAGPRGYVGGQAPQRSAVLTASAAEEAEQRARELAAQIDSRTAELEAAQAELAEARQLHREATLAINESDARITGAAERLARLHKELVTLASQREVVAAQHAEINEVLERDRAALSELNARGPELDLEEPEIDPAADEIAAALDEELEAARERELDARVKLERITEQSRHLELQAIELRREADEVELALEEAARRREARRRGIARCGELAAFCQLVVEGLERSIEEAQSERDRLQQAIKSERQEVEQARAVVEAAAEDLEAVREQRHAADLRRADLEHQLEQLTARIREDFGLSPDEVAAEHPDAAHYERAPLQEREDTLTRKLGLLGRVNPLALEEFKALEDRHRFLSEQLDDLRRSKRDLEQVVIAVDGKIEQIFADAYEDVAREFGDIFETLFPGGKGRLVLTDPDDMLTTGIEVEAQPPGKKVKRLSLLSGGERSLTVLAFVFAIFRA